MDVISCLVPDAVDLATSLGGALKSPMSSPQQLAGRPRWQASHPESRLLQRSNNYLRCLECGTTRESPPESGSSKGLKQSVYATQGVLSQQQQTATTAHAAARAAALATSARLASTALHRPGRLQKCGRTTRWLCKAIKSTTNHLRACRQSEVAQTVRLGS